MELLVSYCYMSGTYEVYPIRISFIWFIFVTIQGLDNVEYARVYDYLFIFVQFTITP